MNVTKRILRLAKMRGWIPQESLHGENDLIDFAAIGLGDAQMEELAREAFQEATLDGNTVCPENWTEGPAAASGQVAMELPVSARFKMATLMAQGGTADVFRAFDTTLHRFVALKFIRRMGAESHDMVIREARAQAQVEHPNVCRVYEVGELGPQPFIAMQWVEGETLRQVGQELDIKGKLEILREVAEGAHAAHARGLIHLDLKPGNILMERLEDGGFRPLISDFGLYLSEGGGTQEVEQQRWLPIGTPPYCSPEQLSRHWASIDRRSDVYSLGVTLYTLLVGRAPFDETDPDALQEAILAGRVVPLRTRAPELAPDLEAIVHRATAFKVADRYDTARHLAEDLNRFLKGEPVSASTSGFFYATRKWVLRNRMLTAALGVVVVVLLGAFAWTSWQSHRAKQWAKLSAYYERLVNDTQFSMMDLAKPLHDTRNTRDAAFEIIVEAEKGLGKDGAFARAPLHLVLGRLYLEQGFLEKAQLHFEASQSYGYAAEDSDVYLGMTLLMRYFTEVGDCSLVPAAERRQRVESADARFKIPALRVLKRYLQEKPGSQVAKICTAVLEDHIDEARTILDTWRAKDPSLDAYSALIVLGLNGKVSLTEARNHPEVVLTAIRSRRESAENVLKATPSQAAAYAELAECYFLEAALFQAETKEGEQLLREASKQATAGLVSEPDNPQILIMAAQVQAALAKNLRSRQLKANAIMAEAQSFARQTLEQLPRWEGYFGSETTRMMRRDAAEVLNTLKP